MRLYASVGAPSLTLSNKKVQSGVCLPQNTFGHFRSKSKILNFCESESDFLDLAVDLGWNTEHRQIHAKIAPTQSKQGYFRGFIGKIRQN